MMLREEIAACEACDLCGSAGVPGESLSDDPPEIMVVGEAPGRQEHCAHRPFVGESGQLLRSWLRQTSLERVYLTNVLKHWPGGGNPDPTDKQVKACLPLLMREIETLRPKLILLVGRFAAHLAFKGTMQKLHGRWGYLDGTPCVAMYHPAFVSRRRGKEHPTFAELEGGCLSILLQVKEFVGPRGTAPHEWGREERLDNHPVTGGAAPPRLHQPLALDYETTSLDPRSCSVLVSATQYGWAPGWVHGFRGSSGEHLVMHHACFDLPILMRGIDEHPGHEPKLVDDTMLIARDLGHADTTLKGLASRILQEPCRSFNDVAQGRRAEDIPLSELGAYCQRDAELTAMLYRTLYREGELTAYEQIDRPLIPILARMTLEGGFWVRREELDAYREELERWIEDCTSAACAWGKFNVNSGDQLAEKLHTDLGLPILSGITNVKRRPVVDEDALKKLVPLHPLPGIMLDLRERTKERGTFVLPWLAGGDRVTTIFEFGADTGRLSSHDPNLQNVPKHLRRFLAAGPGNMLVCADYSQIELRVAAHLSQDEAMLSIFRSDGDLHEHTAAQLFNEVNEDTRRQAKIFNFGVLLYLGGPENIAEELGVSRAIGARLAQAGRVAFPGYYNWAERTAAEARVRGYTEGVWGRRRYLNFVEADRHAVRQAVNAPIQGGATDICKRAMHRLERPLRELGGKQVCQIHDEIVAEIPTHRVAEAKQVLSTVCAEDNPLDVPIKVEVKASETWG